VTTAKDANKPRTRRHTRRSALSRFRTAVAVTANSLEHSESARHHEAASTVSAEDNAYAQYVLELDYSLPNSKISKHCSID
jgi:hypothetical protein